VTPALIFSGLAVLAVTCADPVAQLLASDMRDAIHRAGRSLKGVAADIDVPLNKLYDQLNGHTPFTYCWRVLCLPDVRVEFFDIQAQRVNAVFVRVEEMRELVVTVKALACERAKRRMAKASLPHVGQKAQAV
jgi:hypothetical protein